MSTSERKSQTEPPTEVQVTPPLPIVKRLNRNALTVAAVLMFVMVLVAVVLTKPTRTPATQANSEAPPSANTHPAFLDQAVRPAVSADPMHTEAFPGVPRPGEALSPDSGLDEATQGQSRPTTGGSGRLPEASATDFGPTSAVNMGAGRTSPSARVDTRTDAYVRALRSPVIQAGGASGPPTSTSIDSTGQDPLRTILAVNSNTAGPAANPPSGTPVSSAASHAHANFLAHIASTTRGSTGTEGDADHLDAGTVIPAALVTAINSDLPGHLLAIVTRNVFDSRTQRRIIIPQGTKLLGEYDADITGGQQRLLIAWTRMIFPDRRSVDLPGVQTADPSGAAGVPGHVDSHYRRVFGNALMLSVIGAGIQLSQPRQGNIYAPASPGQVAAGAAGQQLGDVAAELIRKNLDIPPTITLPAGTALNVFLSADLVLPQHL